MEIAWWRIAGWLLCLAWLALIFKMWRDRGGGASW